MQILVVSATEAEIAPFIKTHPQADILITGVGTPSAMYHLTKRLHQIDYDLVIQTGIAGAFDAKMAHGNVYAITADTFADTGVHAEGHFTSVFDNGLADANYSPYIKGWLPNEDLQLYNLEIPLTKAITVNTITDDKQLISQMEEKYKAKLESMEGAVLHYVCRSEGIHFLQLRAVSNAIGERDKNKWSMQHAIENLNKELHNLYDRLLHETIVTP